MIEFCFDFVSPYSYLAWTQVGELGARVGHDVEPIPVLFAGILDALGTKGPAEVPAAAPTSARMHCEQHIAPE